MATFVRDAPGWKHTFQSTQGPVGAYFKDLGKGGVRFAKQKVSIESGKLYRSINTYTGIMYGNVYTDYGSSNRIAYIHHEGAKRHGIKARNPNGYLRFYWKKRQRWVTVKSVKHPGHRPNPYLTYRLRQLVV